MKHQEGEIITIDFENLHHTLRGFNIDIAENNAVYDVALDRFLKILGDKKVTFFIIGKDAELNPNLVKKIHKRGHEIANHTYSHPFNITEEMQYYEIKKCHNILKDITGQHPRGFRAPYCFIDDDTIKMLEGLNYEYDSSVIPTIMLPLMKLGYKINGFKPGGGYLSSMFKRRTPHIIKGSSITEYPWSVNKFGIPYYSTTMFMGQQRPNINYLNFCFHGIDLIGSGDGLPEEAFKHKIIAMDLDDRIEKIKHFLEELK